MSARAFRVAYAILDRRGRAFLACIAALTAAERVLLVVVATIAVSSDRARIAAWVALLVGMYFVRAFLRGALRVMVQKQLHRRAATALLSADPMERPLADGGDPEVVLGDGVHYGSQLLAERAPQLAGDVLASIAGVVFLGATLPPRLLVVGGVGLAFAMSAGIAARRITTRAQEASWAAYRPLLDRMLLVMRSRVELVANAANDTFLATLDRLLASYEEETVRGERLMALAARVPLAAGAIGLGLALLGQRGMVASSGGPIGDLIVLASVLPAFVGLAQNGHEARRLTLAFRPMASLLTMPVAVIGGTSSPPAEVSPIVLRDIAFRYPGASRDAVTGVSVRFARGEPLVLSGPNGSGKSTILRLLAALGTPTRGTLTCGDSDLSRIDPGQWRSLVAYLPQQPHLADGMSVGEAIAMLVPAVSPEETKGALARVGVLDALVARGADSPLDVRMAHLSIGQRKRVAIARILLKKEARIVLLDEPDANLDAEGVAMVAELARELAGSKLVAIAAHTERMVASPGVHLYLAA